MAPDVKFTANRLGGVALVIDGCKYRINRRSGQTVYWRCFFRWCRANAVVEAGKLKSSCGVHICSQPLKGRHCQDAVTAAAGAAAAAAAAAASVKMATRANQLTSSTAAATAAAASKTKKVAAATNNNMVVQRKAAKLNVKLQNGHKTDKNDKNRSAVQQQQQPPPPPPSNPPPLEISIKSEDVESSKQVRKSI